MIGSIFVGLPLKICARYKNSAGGGYMKINPRLLCLSSAVTAAILWTAYSALVFSLTFLAINLSGEMAYLNFSNFDWKLTFIQFIVYLIVWSSSAGLTGWLIAAFYNFLSESRKLQEFLDFKRRFYR